MPGNALPLVDVGVEHTIEVKPDAIPKAFKPRRLSQSEMVEVRKEIEDLCKQGLIETSTSLWVAPIVCARRNNGKLRLAMDYRALNAQSISSSVHPMPLIDDLLDRLGEACYFTTLALKSGYHQMPLQESDKALTVFVVPWGQYQWKRGCPFGLQGAPSTFSKNA